MSILTIILGFLGIIYYTFNSLILNPKFWLCGSLLIFFLFGGGASYIISDTPFFGLKNGIP
jgi:hypothetical protein